MKINISFLIFKINKDLILLLNIIKNSTNLRKGDLFILSAPTRVQVLKSYSSFIGSLFNHLQLSGHRCNWFQTDVFRASSFFRKTLIVLGNYIIFSIYVYLTVSSWLHRFVLKRAHSNPRLDNCGLKFKVEPIRRIDISLFI